MFPRTFIQSREYMKKNSFLYPIMCEMEKRAKNNQKTERENENAFDIHTKVYMYEKYFPIFKLKIVKKGNLLLHPFIPFN